MAATQAELEARRDKLDKAMQSGVLRIQHGDTSTEYRSLDEMRKARAMIDAQLASLAGKPARRVRYIQSSKGY